LATTLYLTDTATGSPYPTTSRLLALAANSSQVQLGPGKFANTPSPGNTGAGQYNPSTPIANNTVATEIDNTGSNPGTTREGWLWDQDFTGYTIPSGTWAGQLRNIELLAGATNTARFIMRVSVVTASGGTWTTVATLLTTTITGETSHSAGQAGWCNSGVVSCATTATNRSPTFATSSTSHVFVAGERLLIELGMCAAGSATARTWGLQYNDANSFLTVPDLTPPSTDTAGAASTSAWSAAGVVSESAAVVGAASTSAWSSSAAAAETMAVAGAATYAGWSAAAAGAETHSAIGAVAYAGWNAAGAVSGSGLTEVVCIAMPVYAGWGTRGSGGRRLSFDLDGYLHGLGAPKGG
jgi:hypothetical protein